MYISSFNCLLLFLFLLFLPLSLSKITIHIIPHSHDDAGWIKTFDEYYTQKVESILTNSIVSLLNNPNRTFVYGEMSFFEKWYRTLNTTTKHQLKSLIKEGRFSFINGGFVMEDEAVSHYTDAANQLRIGLEFMQKELNYTPTVGWFLDQFGHSDSHAYIYQQFGFKYLVLNRMSTITKKKLYSENNLEFYWKPFNTTDEVFTHVIYDYFVPPKPIRTYVKDKKIEITQEKLHNVCKELLTIVQKAVKGYKHNHFIIYYGDDFVFTQANINYENIEMVMDYMNTHMSEQVELKYSTPERYFEEIEKELSEQTLMRYVGDFVPLVDGSIWTGYYTSRPYLKGKIKESSTLLRIANNLMSELLLSSTSATLKEVHSYYDNQLALQEAVAMNQHHDAITGTAKTYVSDDYIDMLTNGENVLMKYLVNKTMGVIHNVNGNSDIEKISICLSNNRVNLGCKISYFDNDSSNTEQFFYVYNPGIDGNVLLTLEFPSGNKVIERSFEIKSIHNETLPYDMYCMPNYKCLVYFFMEVSKEVSFTAFSITNTNNHQSTQYKQTINLNTINIINEDSYTYNVVDNRIITANGKYHISLNHGYLKGTTDGAYILNPKDKVAIKYNITREQSVYYKGTISSCLLLRTTNSSIMLIIFNDPFFIQTVSLIDPIPPKPKQSINVLLIVESNINNNKVFYTDTSGMQIVKRMIVTDKYKTGETFYPICSSVSIESQNNDSDNNTFKRLTVFNDRGQGVTSIHNGVIYVMINRWSSRDDNKGVNEKLYEPQSTQVAMEIKHIIALDVNDENENRKVKDIAENYLQNGLLLFNMKDIAVQQQEQQYMNVRSFKLEDLFIHAKNIHKEIIYVDKKRMMIQFFNAFDPFWTRSSELPSYYNTITVMLNNLKQVKIKECTMNGFMCVNIVKQNITLRTNLRKHFYNDYPSFVIEPLQFKVFEIKFN